MQITILGAAVVAATFCGTAFAQSAPASDVPTGVVQISDLDLASPAGVARARQRIASTARAICQNGGSEVEQLKVRTARATCAKHAVADGEAKLVTVLAQRQSGTAVAAATLTIGGR